MNHPKCIVCGSLDTINAKVDPHIPRCKKHKDYHFYRTCPSCGKKELVAHGHTDSLCRECHLRGRTKQKHQTRDENCSKKFLKFLSKARTRRELEDRFEEPDKLLQQDYPGYSLFQQRNEFGEPIWILLPVVNDKIEIKQRDWRYAIGVDDESDLDPYLSVQLPNSFVDGRIRIVPIFDVHLGHVAHRKEKFLSYLRWIEENPNIYVILGGDIMENALDDGRGMSYESTNPQSQIDLCEKLLSRIAHKILCSTVGNHEWRTYKKSGIDPMRFLCSRLEIPYFDGPVFMSVSANSYTWLFYIFHGRSNAQTKGGKLNAAQAAKRFTGLIHFLVSGHTHDPQVNPETLISIDYEHARLKYTTQWTVVAQSFLGWKNTYAYRAGYPPPGRGGVTMEVFDNGEYRATLK